MLTAFCVLIAFLLGYLAGKEDGYEKGYVDGWEDAMPISSAETDTEDYFGDAP